MARPTNQFREFARVGAQARLREIQEEIATLRREFPELRTAGAAKAESPAAASAGAAAPAAPKKRRTMSKAARAKIAAAQRARWARVRAEQ